MKNLFIVSILLSSSFILCGQDSSSYPPKPTTIEWVCRDTTTGKKLYLYIIDEKGYIVEEDNIDTLKLMPEQINSLHVLQKENKEFPEYMMLKVPQLLKKVEAVITITTKEPR